MKKFVFLSKVSKICKDAFYSCSCLTKIEFSQNSHLQTIESHAFSGTSIEGIVIPSKASKICGNAFSDCFSLQIVEISEESELETFPLSAFDDYEYTIFMIPSNKIYLIK